MIFIKNYNQRLRNSQPIKIENQQIKPTKGSLASIKNIPELVIPPLNTNIDFTSLKFFNIKKQYTDILNEVLIPDFFNWGEYSVSDSDDIKIKKNLITKPQKQFLCGSCWAVSTASAISDNFVVSNIVNWFPNLSPTWCLSNYPQYQCDGGNPSILVDDITQGGISTNHCIDYSWCKEDPKCNRSSSDQTTDLSTLIPTNGCYFGKDKEYYLYKTDSSQVISFIPSLTSSSDYYTTVKKHIYTKGPVIAGFIVYKNFLKGSFSHINGGVYLERGEYDKASSGQDLTFSDIPINYNNYAGCHAVVIVGWGIANNILVNTGKYDNVPYWIVRNSWGTSWGENGFFKMAMYPYNTYSQFDKIVTIYSSNDTTVRGGGIILINVSQNPELKTLDQLDPLYLTQKRSNEDNFYQSDPKFIPSIGDNGGDNTVNDLINSGGIHGKVKYIIIFSVILIILILIFIIRRLSSKIKFINDHRPPIINRN